MGEPPSGGGMVSRQRWRVRRVVDTWENFSHHFEKCLHAMQLQLTAYVKITIFLFIGQKPGEISIFRTFIANSPIFAYILQKSGYFELGDDYDVTHCDVIIRIWYLFWYVWNEETTSYTMVPIRCIREVSCHVVTFFSRDTLLFVLRGKIRHPDYQFL